MLHFSPWKQLRVSYYAWAFPSVFLRNNSHWFRQKRLQFSTKAQLFPVERYGENACGRIVWWPKGPDPCGLSCLWLFLRVGWWAGGCCWWAVRGTLPQCPMIISEAACFWCKWIKCKHIFIQSLAPCQIWTFLGKTWNSVLAGKRLCWVVALC